MQRRLFLHAALGTAAVLALPGCGFKLREAPVFAFKSIQLAAPQGSPFTVELERSLASNDTLRVLRYPSIDAPAEAVFELISELRDRVVVGMSASREVRELQLRLRLKFRLRTAAGKELIAPTEILQQRDVSYSETIALAKEAEEALLYRNMQTDVVQQIVRRLAAVKSL